MIPKLVLMFIFILFCRIIYSNNIYVIVKAVGTGMLFFRHKLLCGFSFSMNQQKFFGEGDHQKLP